MVCLSCCMIQKPLICLFCSASDFYTDLFFSSSVSMFQWLQHTLAFLSNVYCQKLSFEWIPCCKNSLLDPVCSEQSEPESLVITTKTSEKEEFWPCSLWISWPSAFQDPQILPVIDLAEADCCCQIAHLSGISSACHTGASCCFQLWMEGSWLLPNNLTLEKVSLNFSA